MPLKLNVDVSRKMGLPDYESVGASCNLEMELDAGLLERDLDGFQARIRGAYVAAHQAVHEELARLQAPRDKPAIAPAPVPVQARSAAFVRNGFSRNSGNGQSPRPQADRSRVPKAATRSQVKAIIAIARRQNTDLAGLLLQEYEVQSPESLTIRQASELIDWLKNANAS
jgi:hypothetical protein